MKKRARPAAKKAHITVTEARRLVRAAQAKRGGRPYKVTPALRERYLGHFGPPVKRSAARKRGGAKKASKRRAA